MLDSYTTSVYESGTMNTHKHDDYLKHHKPEDKDRDKEVIEKLDQSIEDNKEARKKRAEEKKRADEEREKKHDPFRFDPWGQY